MNDALVARTNLEAFSGEFGFVPGNVDGRPHIGQPLLHLGEQPLGRSPFLGHPIIGVGRVEDWKGVGAKQCRKADQGSRLGAVSVDHVGLEFPAEGEQAGPGPQVPQLGSVGDPEVADRSPTGTDPIDQMNQPLASPDIRIGQGDCLP